MRRIVAQIPHGFQADNNAVWINHVTIREFIGYDEQLLASSQNFFTPIKTSLLLAKIVEFKNTNNNFFSSDFDVLQIIRNLTVGDRVALILQLRKITLGNILHCIIHCPNCAEKLSIDLPIDSILQPPNPNPQPTYTTNINSHDQQYALQIRPINGADLETLIQNPTPQPITAGDDSGGGVDVVLSEKLLRACIVFSDPPLPKTLSSQFQEQLSKKLSEIDPQADLTLNITCTLCSKTLQTTLDIEDFFFQEIASRYPQLEREIHWIALHYHWDEKTILSLPTSKRKRYVELINASITGENL